MPRPRWPWPPAGATRCVASWVQSGSAAVEFHVFGEIVVAVPVLAPGPPPAGGLGGAGALCRARAALASRLEVPEQGNALRTSSQQKRKNVVRFACLSRDCFLEGVT